MNRLAALDEMLLLVAATSGSTEGDTKAAIVRRCALRVVNDFFGNDTSSRELVDGAIDVLASRQIYRVEAQPSNRSFVAIDPGVSTTARRYVCFDDFCSCPSWHETAADAEGPVLCKHMLAARIAPYVTSSTLSLRIETIPDSKYHEAISGRYETL